MKYESTASIPTVHNVEIMHACSQCVSLVLWTPGLMNVGSQDWYIESMQ